MYALPLADWPMFIIAPPGRRLLPVVNCTVPLLMATLPKKVLHHQEPVCRLLV